MTSAIATTALEVARVKLQTRTNANIVPVMCLPIVQIRWAVFIAVVYLVMRETALNAKILMNAKSQNLLPNVFATLNVAMSLPVIFAIAAPVFKAMVLRNAEISTSAKNQTVVVRELTAQTLKEVIHVNVCLDIREIHF